MDHPAEVLGEHVAKLLSDKLYEKRKQAAIEIETKVRDILAQQSPVQAKVSVQRIVTCLHRDYIENKDQANHRKGGVLGVANIAIALGTQVDPFLDQLVKPVILLCLKDDEARVRYYACEALYNIAKVADETMLVYFNDVFDGLCRLYADVDNEVKNAASVLDRLMKDIVTQFPRNLNIEKLVPLLAERMQNRNPYIRQMVLAWITMLLKVDEIDMLRYTKQYLEGLFNMLSDQSKDIRHNADSILETLKQRLASLPTSSERQINSISDSVGTVVKFCKAEDPNSKLTALNWLVPFIKMQVEVTRSIGGQPAEAWVQILPELLGGTLHCIDDHQEEIGRMAVEMNNSLLELVQAMEDDISTDDLVDELLSSLKRRESIAVRTACLQWICMLLTRRQAQMLERSTLNRFFNPIFDTLKHPEDEVVVAALTALAQIMRGRTPEQDEQGRDAAKSSEAGADDEGDLFKVVTHKLLDLFKSKRDMLQSRGRLMIRQLCAHLSPRRLYITVARAIKEEGETDIEFAQQLVQTFAWILLTAIETKALREELLQTAPLIDSSPSASSGSRAAPQTTKPAGQAEELPLFLELLEPWYHNPVSALALCLWAQQYELAAELTARLAEFEPSLDLLRQLDQLVHLLESPMFSRLRLRLLEPREHPALLKCLLGLAMLLPQAGAFNILRERITVVQSGLLLESTSQREPLGESSAEQPAQATSWWGAGRGDSQAAAASTKVDISSLLERFDSVAAAAQGYSKRIG
eukprot:TRINITY_DN16583_c0_g1_i1.p1 TRINITY_DN16583_c0_g1~~TRINITY_DN16583_c0_g1_i1.p1  ORF type:complete len:753 (+),score=205.81 TRINITY_DN16583_c0_g1_i1:67-2325(+)